MEINREEIFKLAQEIIKELKIDRITNLYGHLAIDIRTFYKCFPVDSEKYNSLIELMKEQEKIGVEN